MTEDLQITFVAPSDNDYDGVDVVTYINGTTWAKETVQCRTPDNPTPVKIEDTTSTELDALCYNVGDRIVLTDDIPGSQTISALIEEMDTTDNKTKFTVTEPLDWSFGNPRVLIRYQDGTASGLMVATRMGDYQVLVPEQPEFSSIILNDPAIEPPRLVFCDSSEVGYNAIISEIAPQSDGTCQVTAKQYKPSFYNYDDATYPGNVT